MTEHRVTQSTVRLADGRRLAVTDVGPTDGHAVVYLHGAIGAPLECRGDLALAIDPSNAVAYQNGMALPSSRASRLAASA